MTAFIITHDLIETGSKGTMGPSSLSQADEARLQSGEGIAFRLLDDDRQVYYKGRRLAVSSVTEDYDSEDELAPLDCFGGPNAGCTIQEEKNKDGKWESIN